MATLLVLVSCGGTAARTGTEPAPTPADAPSAQAADAVAGVTDPALRALLADHWDWSLRQSPEWASTMGDHRFDSEISDPSAAAITAARAAEAGFLDRARAIDEAALSLADRVTLQIFREELTSSLALAVCDDALWTVAANGNPVTRWNYLPAQHPLRSAADGDSLLARYRQVPAAVDASIANLRAGLARGLVANRTSIERTLALVAGQLEAPIGEWALATPAAGDELTAAQKKALLELVGGEIKAAYARYRDLLANELLPRARTEAVGLTGLPIGEACYRARIQHFTGLERSARELHDLGLAEIARINGEMRALGESLFGAAELAAILARLRTDRALYFATRDEIVAGARESLAAAEAAAPRYFGILPAADCTVVPIPDYEAPYSTIAYYRQPHADGSKPGEYFVNTHAPETRPRFEAQVLAYHESIPGHHLQIAISMERSQLPAFRRHGGKTAFVEGWALYTERLADEMGLYSGDLDRMGMLSYDAWRASRLVVDTGIHAFGWSRKQAEEFMLAHTALAPNNIVNEVDRYIGWPGQALAYKVGQLEIRRLRALAEAELGAAFDIRAFHDAVLSSGAVSLTVLEAQIKAWIAQHGSAR